MVQKLDVLKGKKGTRQLNLIDFQSESSFRLEAAASGLTTGHKLEMALQPSVTVENTVNGS